MDRSHATTLRPAPRWAWRARGYALYQGLQQLRRRKLASFSTLAVLGITLALPVAAWFGAGALGNIAARGLAEESLTLYLNPGLPDLDGAELAQRLASQPGIRDLRYVSHDEALAEFESSTPIEDVMSTLGHNPLPGLIIVWPEPSLVSDPTRLDALAARLRDARGVDSVQIDLEWTRRLQAMLGLVKVASWLLAGFLTLTGLLVIGNTVRLELFRRRREFEVAELLGASRSFLNRPILYTGLLYGLLGGAVAAGLGTLALYLLKSRADALAGLYASSFRLPLPGAVELGIVIVLGGILGLMGALTALRQPIPRQLSNR